jgi:lactoylglutathione lyase
MNCRPRAAGGRLRATGGFTEGGTPLVTGVAGRGGKGILAGMKARKLLHTRYRVNDLSRTVKFYREILGLEEVRRHKSPRGSELVFLKAPESEELIEICSFPASGPVQVQPDLTHLAFEVDDLAGFAKHLEKFDLKYSDGPHFKEDGSGFAFIDAPEGYEIELMQRGRTGKSDS